MVILGAKEARCPCCFWIDRIDKLKPQFRDRGGLPIVTLTCSGCKRPWIRIDVTRGHDA